MLLSRVANSLYWFGRYLERAENANRHLIVASEFAVELEGINEEIAVREWESLVNSMPSAVQPSVSDRPGAALQYMTCFLLDRDNPFSVISSLAKARENARSVSETTTFEVTYNLNECYRRLTEIRPGQMTDLGVALEVASNTHNSILTTLGAVEHTLTRGQGWNYMKLGEAMERTQRTLFVLKTRLPSLARWADQADMPLGFASWSSLLRSLASQENFRQEHGPRFVPDLVTRFMLFSPAAPRAVNCGVRRMVGYVRGMPDAGPGIAESRRRLGKLASQLEFDQEQILQPGALVPFLEESLANLADVHDAISNPVRLF